MVKFIQTKKVVQSIKSKNIQKDLMKMITRTEKTVKVSKKTAGIHVSNLIRTAVSLENTLPKKTRKSLVNAIFNDTKEELPHQWARYTDHECTGKGCIPHVGTDCAEDTVTHACYSY